MRGGVRRIEHEAEEESAFVSMTDLTVSFLFIVMILLAFFASQYSDEATVPKAQLDDMKSKLNEMTDLRNLASAQRDMALRSLTEAQNEIVELKAKLAAAQRTIAAREAEIAKRNKPTQLETYISDAAQVRAKILTQLRDQLKLDFPALDVVVSQESDALRFQGEGLFATGRSDLAAGPKATVAAIAQRLATILPCYTLGEASHWSADCNPNHAVVEAVQIEGHTDDTGNAIESVRRTKNLELSTDRANTTFTTMLADAPRLIDYRNQLDQPVMGVAGYGQMRPIASNNTDVGRSINRRIDLRLIMYTPSGMSKLAEIVQRLGSEPQEKPSAEQSSSGGLSGG